MSEIMTAKLKRHSQISLKNIYFNRFLAIRYSSAFFLFLNLYWAIFLLGSLSIATVLPLFLFVLGIGAALEQIKLYHHHSNKLPWADFFYKAVLFSSIVLLIALHSPLYRFFYPFINNTQDVLNILAVLFSVNIVISLLMLKKLNKIKHNQDKHLNRIKAYEEIIN